MSLLVYLEKLYLEMKHCRIKALYDYFLAPLLDFLQWLLVGLFVKVVTLGGIPLPYLYFLVISSLFFDMVMSGVDEVLYKFYSKKTLYIAQLKGMKFALAAILLERVVRDILSYLPTLVLLYLLVSKNLYSLVFGILASLLLIIPALAIAMLASPLLLKFKGSEAMAIRWDIYFVMRFLLPVSYTYTAFSFYNYLKYLPVTNLFEELRKLVLVGSADVAALIIGFIESVALLFVGIYVFGKAYERARKEGWIGLR